MTILILYALLLGICVGSFINALVWRLHQGISIMNGRSMCTNCKHTLVWYDLIPLVSFLILKGKCRYCKKAISWQYPAVEFIVGILFALSAFIVLRVHADQSFFSLLSSITIHEWVLLVRNFYLISVLTVIFIYDLRWYMILDSVTIPAIGILFLFNIAAHGQAVSICNPLSGICHSIPTWTSYVLASILGAGFFALQYIISRGKWIGGGDIRLGALMGATLGLPLVGAGLFGGYLLGTAVAVPLLLAKRKGMKSELPFGTVLSIATLFVLLFQTSVEHIIAMLFFT